MDATTATRMLDDRAREVEARLARLREDDDSLRHDRADATADDEHDPEGSTLSGEWAQVDALRRGAEAERDEIRAARERVASGVYGTCEACGRPIAEARLEARPFARRCIACAT
ncbi:MULTISPECIES: TraR/DksA family transcriptional regulator [Microbacterium]|jgi:RNA polymerase-binding transcription factor DksA|uniref:Molecular chaperone DnaK n=2 Tax=Microbacterium testaceum TaxID=2033 RepID=A0A2T7W1E3_MICTE|nr:MULTISPECIES: TraR/DksA C4-type zinc finger protein [Microbacterium]PTT17086.1 molecular chaperone DnaK [Microbacterium sp. HMWF026]PVE62754.1 molecular chaperone DnaK [Microbacterium testaceum]